MPVSLNNKKTLIFLVVILSIIILYLYYMSNSNREVSGYDQKNRNENNLAYNLSTYESTVKPKLILYYAMWCGYSRQFLPEWEKFEQYATENLKNINIEKINCEGDNESICNKKGVPGFPYIVLEKSDGKILPFDGDRTVEELVKFLQNNA